MDELACFLCNNDDLEEAEQFIYDKYGVSYESFSDIANDLIKLTPKIKTEITKTVCHAFLNEKDSIILAMIEADK